MKKGFSLTKIISIFLALLLSLTLAVSCSGKEEKPAPPKEKEKIPKELTSMEESVEEIFKDMDKLDEEMKKPEEPKKPEGEGEKKEEGKKEESQDGGSSGDSGSKEEGSSGGEKEQSKEEKPKTKEEKITEIWKGIEDKAKEIHTQWNGYESKAIEDGVMNEDIEEFEKSIDKLTISLMDKKIVDSLFYLNNTTFYMAKFFDMYKDHPDGEMLRLRYFSRQIYLYGLSGDWTKANETVPSLDQTIVRIRQRIEVNKDNEKIIKKLELSLGNLANAIDDKNPDLLKIKVDIILKNIEELRDATK